MNAQEMIIGHVLPIAASIAVLWVAYRLLFSNSNRLKFNRMYLLTSLLFALALPLMGLFVGHEAPQVVTLKQNLFGGSMLNEIVVTPDGQPVMPDAPSCLMRRWWLKPQKRISACGKSLAASI